MVRGEAPLQQANCHGPYVVIRDIFGEKLLLSRVVMKDSKDTNLYSQNSSTWLLVLVRYQNKITAERLQNSLSEQNYC
jgi:hypothetical protein